VESCDPVSRDEALRIWDAFGAVGSTKNRTTSPMLYSIDPKTNAKSASCGKLPAFLDTISPAPMGRLYRDAGGA